MPELSDFALPYGVTKELSACEACTHARFRERYFGGAYGALLRLWALPGTEAPRCSESGKISSEQGTATAP